MRLKNHHVLLRLESSIARICDRHKHGLTLVINSAAIVFLFIGVTMLGLAILQWDYNDPPHALETVRPGHVIPSGALITPSGEKVRLHDSGQYTLVYFFRSTCSVCAALRDTVDAWLARKSSERVVTVTSEPDSVVASYWRSGDRRPVTVTSSSMIQAGITIVPQFLVLDEHGRVLVSETTSAGFMAIDSTLAILPQDVGVTDTSVEVTDLVSK